MSSDTSTTGFESLAELQQRHEALLSKASSEGQSLSAIGDDEVKALLDSAAEVGSVLSDAADRRSARTIMRFWSAELIARGEGKERVSVPELAPAAPQERRQDQPKTQTPAQDEAELARVRRQVRIAASARQWLASQDAGWLLKGDALREAEEFANVDDDIRKLVEASRRDSLKRSRVIIALAVGVIAALLPVCGMLYLALKASHRSELALVEALDRATEARVAANAESAVATRQQRELSEVLSRQAQLGREQQLQLDQRQHVTQDVATFVQQLLKEGRITESEVPEGLRPIIATIDQQTPPPISLQVLEQYGQGYDPAFLRTAVGTSKQPQQDNASGITVPLPKLAPQLAAQAWDEGRPVSYVNFGIILHKTRRMAIVTAVNLQRSGVVPLLRPRDSQFRLDVRLPTEIQLPPGSLPDKDLDRGQLVNAREIAWGPAFGSDPAVAGQRASGLVYLSPNIVPQYDTFNRGVWLGAERYARETFSADSDRVIIFSGPVFAAEDPSVDGVQVPRFFWKVLAATRSDNAASVVVEAYLVPQLGPTNEKVAPSVEFKPDVYRVGVSDIERLTGLDFGDVVRGADIGSRRLGGMTQASVPGGSMADRLPDVIGPDEAVRKSRMQQLLNFIRSDQTAEGDLRPLVEAIIAMTAKDSFDRLGAEARVNVLTLLAAVPRKLWDLPRWIDLKAVARRSVADATALLACPSAQQACGLIIDTLKPNLDWGLAVGRTVYVQFAGMVRQDVQALSEKLKALGWSVPAEERIATAAGLNEVRYGDSDDDRRAAELLAADLRALGRSAVRAKQVKGIRPKTPEVWISI